MYAPQYQMNCYFWHVCALLVLYLRFSLQLSHKQDRFISLFISKLIKHTMSIQSDIYTCIVYWQKCISHAFAFIIAIFHVVEIYIVQPYYHNFDFSNLSSSIPFVYSLFKVDNHVCSMASFLKPTSGEI